VSLRARLVAEWLAPGRWPRTDEGHTIPWLLAFVILCKGCWRETGIRESPSPLSPTLNQRKRRIGPNVVQEGGGRRSGAGPQGRGRQMAAARDAPPLAAAAANNGVREGRADGGVFFF
jgi:hypothetical protein